MNRESLERDILGQVLLDFNLVDVFLAKLKETDFKDIRNRNLYKFFAKLSRDNITVFDFSDICATYPKAVEVCGGMQYLGELISNCDIATHFIPNIKALIKLSTIESVKALAKNSEEVFKKDFSQGIAYVESTLQEIVDRVSSNESVDLYKAFKSSMANANKINIDFGYKTLHNFLGYPHPGELMIIGARPGMGKTAFALACLFNYICKKQKKAVMFSLEMSGLELFNRMLSSISAIPLQNIRAGALTESLNKILDNNAKELSSNEYLSLYDKTVSTIPALRAAIRKENKNKPVGLVVVDYLQLLSGTGSSTYEKVSDISRQLKLIAREFNCTVVALSQLSRKVEERADKRPQLSDLRESGSIEQDADYVLFLYRHNYYAKDPTVDPTNEPINIEIAKNRHGKTGTVQLSFDLTTGRFSEEVK